jgi:hypothetical protein
MKCKYCEEYDLNDWDGDKPKCAFDDNGIFTTLNWNCGTMNKLRRIVEETQVYSNDSHSALIPIEYEGKEEDNFVYADFILLNWYKSRGRTDLAKIITSGNDIQDLTLNIAYEIIEKGSVC